MIIDMLAGHARKRADEPFVVTDDGTYTYRVIHDRSLRLAGVLAGSGIGRGDHVAILCGNSAAFLVGWFAANVLGAVAVTLNHQLKAPDVDYLLTQSDSKVVLADQLWLDATFDKLNEVSRAIPVIAIGSDEAFLAGLDAHEPVEAVRCEPSEICTILYTSGTTGLPKGVLCTHAAYVATGRESARILELRPDDRTMVFLPLFHTNPQTYAVMSALTVGCSIVLRPKFSATTFFQDARRFGATGCTFVGTVLSILAARYADPQKDHAMRFCIGGGTTEELATAMQERFGLFVHELYGMTETGGWVSGSPRSEHRIGSNGRIRADMELQIFDGDDRQVPTGTRGEIVVRPREPHVMLAGYYNKADQMVASTRNLWFHTGDIGSYDADGFLYFHGRSKELIRRGGEMVSPVAIEEKLRAMPGVADCAAVGVPDAIMGEEIKIVVTASSRLEPHDVRAFLDDKLPKGLLPRYVEFMDVIPRTESEKILRRNLIYVDERVIDLTRQSPD